MLDVRIKVRLRLFDARCPSCNSSNLRPGMIRPWVENLLLRGWLLLSFRRPYLCRDCDTRFYDFRLKGSRMKVEDPDIKTILQEYRHLVSPSDPIATEPDAGKKDRTA